MGFVLLGLFAGKKHTTLQTCACLSFDDDSRQFKIGRSIFSCKLQAALLVLENSMHNFELEVCKRYNRSGTLCGECLSNHWPLALSYKMDCTLYIICSLSCFLVFLPIAEVTFLTGQYGHASAIRLLILTHTQLLNRIVTQLIMPRVTMER